MRSLRHLGRRGRTLLRGLRERQATARALRAVAAFPAVAERAAHGRFASLEDCFCRMPPGAMNRRQLEGLAGAGAFDSLEPSRAKVLANADILLAVADAASRPPVVMTTAGRPRSRATASGWSA